MRCESLCEAYDAVLGLALRWTWFQDEVDEGRERGRSRVCGVSVGIKLVLEIFVGMKCEDVGEDCRSVREHQT